MVMQYFSSCRFVCLPSMTRFIQNHSEIKNSATRRILLLAFEVRLKQTCPKSDRIMVER